MGEKLDQALAVLNGLVGDYLVREGNALATEMALYVDGTPLPLERDAIARVHPTATAKPIVLVHGVMCTESVWRFADGSDYGSRLQTAGARTPLYVRYNSGRPIADNGSALAELLQALVTAYPRPIEALTLVGYSMGGLVVRSACHFAAERGLPWLPLVTRSIYVGTPHLGAPAERAGRLVSKVLHAIPDPYTKLIGTIADLRSAGVKDLGDGDLRHQDRAALDGRLSLLDQRHPVPLLPAIEHVLIAGSLAMDPRVAALFGDAVVPVASATARGGLASLPGSVIPAEHVHVIPGLSHLDIAHHEQVYEVLSRYCSE